MRPDELGSMFFAAAIIEEDLSCILETVNFMKLVSGVRQQSVGFGHFKEVFEPSSCSILQRADSFFAVLCHSYPILIQSLHELCVKHNVSAESPLGIIVHQTLVVLESYPVCAIPTLIKSYREWISAAERNPLPLLLPPDLLFSEHNPDLILSPLPSYSVPPPTFEAIESVAKTSHQSYLYHALLHAKQQKTVQATEEMGQCCLKLTEKEDPSWLARSSIALAQIFDLLGLREESVLALNESIGSAKQLSDSSVIAAAVALKAQIDSSSAAWRYAADILNPHPLSAVRVALEKGSFSEALEIDAYVTANIFGEKDWQIARLVPLHERLIPVSILKLVRDCNWRKAAATLHFSNLGRLEVRATALAFAVVFFEVQAKDEIAGIYREEYDEVMAIEFGHFKELKPTIREIADCFRVQIPIGIPDLPLEEPLMTRIKWMCQTADTDERRAKCLELCARFQIAVLFDDLVGKLSVGTPVCRRRQSKVETLNLDAFLNEVMNES
jgi:hypothetical protein